MSPREKLWPGCGTRVEREARRVQKRGDFKGWSTQHERRNGRNNGSSPALSELPRVNPKAYYRTGDRILVKGVELAEGILPVNLQPTTPPFWGRLKKEWRLFMSTLGVAKP